MQPSKSDVKRPRTSTYHDHSANTTSASSSYHPRPVRRPLLSLDRNAQSSPRASLRGAPLSTRSGNDAATNMVQEKTNSSRPNLSASGNAKLSSKAPLTPRVAGSAPVNTSTPLSRRNTRPESNVGTPVQDLSTPVTSFLAHNVTPRSSSRKSRVDSTNTTPTHTPTPTPVLDTFHFANGQEHARSPITYDGSTKSPSLDVSLTQGETIAQKPQQQEIGSRFFYASDAKTGGQPPRPQRPGLPPKAATFVYANGESIPTLPSSTSAAVGSAPLEEKSQPKFLHAHRTPNLSQSPSPYFPTTISHSQIQGVVSPRLAQNQTFLSPPQRPPSPLKQNQNVANPIASRKLPSVVSNSINVPPILARGHTVQDIRLSRRVSIEAPPRPTVLEKAYSIGVLQLGQLSKRDSLTSNSGLLTSSLTSVPQVEPSNPASSEVSVQEAVTAEDTSNVEEDIARPQSPVKTGTTLEKANELAAEARRDRKVLDLEIRNSSLTAINRTLEREMRKQTAELRRFRRLSRSGRLSVASAATGRTSTGTLPVIGEDGMPLYDMSEEEDEDGEVSEGDDSSGLDDESLSPTSRAESDLRHRQRDEKRLQLDLSKHQQLLIDSQKMNQSLKRCMAWSEEMINEGKKALDYSVRVSDIELGGRVLVPEELDEHHEAPDEDVPEMDLDHESRKFSPDARQDRDSGVHLNPTGQVL